MIVDVEALLQPVPGDLPAGPDLSFDRDFRRFEAELEELTTQAVRYNDPTAAPGIEKAVALLARSRDLWIASHGFCFAACAGDIAAAAGLLDVMAGIAERFWDGCYPSLMEGSDPTDARQQACRQVAHFGRSLRYLENAYLPPLAEGARLSFRQVMGGAPADAGGAEIMAQMPEAIRRAINDTGLEPWAAFGVQLDALAGTAARIGAAFTAHGASREPDLRPLTDLVGRMKTLCEAVIAQKNPAGAPAGDGGAAALAGQEASAMSQVSGPGPSRAAALAHLDAARSYFQTMEPSSPIPLMIDRIKKVAGMDFMQIVQSLAPAGVDEALRILDPAKPGDGEGQT
jgi:type VI secretion system protein ImpA